MRLRRGEIFNDFLNYKFPVECAGDGIMTIGQYLTQLL